jgi:hypothetical protein
MRYNTGLTAAPASPLYGSPVCKRRAVTHPSTDCAQCCLTSVIEGTGAFNIAYGHWLIYILSLLSKAFTKLLKRLLSKAFTKKSVYKANHLLCEVFMKQCIYKAKHLQSKVFTKQSIYKAKHLLSNAFTQQNALHYNAKHLQSKSFTKHCLNIYFL